jgi:DNA-binding response OmpR family regulator/anti-sigma regulatory factor (Ser/Thr protein kinase)
MKILVADDTEVMLLLVRRFVETLGHQAIQARNGGEAVELYEREKPALVLLDMMMPVMDGAEAARRIKAINPEVWVPIIYITAIGEEAKLAEAIEQGADDYLVKPINFRILEAKIKAIERTIGLHNRVIEQSVKLAEYVEHAEEEKRVARHLMDQMVNTARLADTQLDYWIQPAESLSGDLIAAARTPGQILHVMLADGIGHGLTAALNVLPLTQPFYAMTEKGFSVADILEEMNSKVRQVLPVGRFVAVAIAAIDTINQRIEIWNGGLPELHLIASDGRLLRSWRSQNLPLGILGNEHFESTPENYYFADEATLVMCSDGLVEATNQVGDMFGVDRLVAVMSEAPLESRVSQLVADLEGFMNGVPCHDDVSLMAVKVRPGHVMLPAKPSHDTSMTLFDFPSEAVLNSSATGWSYKLVLGANELKYFNVVPLVMNFLSQVQMLKASQSEVFLILSELLTNAIDHGVLGLSSSLKQGPDGMENYFMARMQGMSSLQQGQISIELSGILTDGRPMLRIYICDSGEGFAYGEDRSQALNTTKNAHGRGIQLVRQLSHKLQYHGRGNEVSALYLPRASSSEDGA